MKKILLFILPVITLLSSSCEKDREPAPTFLRLTKLEKTSTDLGLASFSYTYNKQGQLEDLRHNEDIGDILVTHTYGNLKDLTKVERYLIGSRTPYRGDDVFTYNTSGQLTSIKSTYFSSLPPPEPHYRSTAFSYDTKGRVIGVVHKHIPTEDVALWYVLEYDDRNNVSSVKYYSPSDGANPPPFIVFTAEYDDKPNPFYKLGSPTGITYGHFLRWEYDNFIAHYSPNNPMKVKEQSFWDSNPYTKNYEISYKYGDRGLPIEIKGTTSYDGQEYAFLHKLEYKVY